MGSWLQWDQDQKARDHALNGLKQGRIRVLVATDVAARGLDIKGIGLVVNYDAAPWPNLYLTCQVTIGHLLVVSFCVSLNSFSFTSWYTYAHVYINVCIRGRVSCCAKEICFVCLHYSITSPLTFVILDILFSVSIPSVLQANNTEDYVHRIGRTGRAGAKGYAVTFLCPSEDGGKVSGIIQANGGCFVCCSC